MPEICFGRVKEQVLKHKALVAKFRLSADLSWETIMHGSEGELKEAPYKEGVVQM